MNNPRHDPLFHASFFLLALIAFLLLFLLPSPTAPQELLLDNFESYALGTTFPCCYPSTVNPGGWELVYSGAGVADQRIVVDPVGPDAQCLQLRGLPGWSSVIQRRFDSDSPVLGARYRILIEQRGSVIWEHPAFTRYRGELPYDPWGTYYGIVYFDHLNTLQSTPPDLGEIWSEDRQTLLGYWRPGEWTTVEILLDRDPASSTYRTYSVWINGTAATCPSPRSVAMCPEAVGCATATNIPSASTRSP